MFHSVLYAGRLVARVTNLPRNEKLLPQISPDSACKHSQGDSVRERQTRVFLRRLAFVLLHRMRRQIQLTVASAFKHILNLTISTYPAPPSLLLWSKAPDSVSLRFPTGFFCLFLELQQCILSSCHDPFKL